ncbi:hypothetical protein CLAC_11890 [Corynebacterium lactis RW2-5]|uniref:Uncharacterized protein n=1 Tax=Corynebacterium lactis RW2-5 TaxID=1408189 RepID=A0A0K2H3W8_9CORY|nr:hypothetical protein CLAC_11890 [Corynebacterium lactis RW2-5]
MVTYDGAEKSTLSDGVSNSSTTSLRLKREGGVFNEPGDSDAELQTVVVWLGISKGSFEKLLDGNGVGPIGPCRANMSKGRIPSGEFFDFKQRFKDAFRVMIQYRSCSGFRYI